MRKARHRGTLGKLRAFGSVDPAAPESALGLSGPNHVGPVRRKAHAFSGNVSKVGFRLAGCRINADQASPLLLASGIDMFSICAGTAPPNCQAYWPLRLELAASESPTLTVTGVAVAPAKKPSVR